MPTLSRTPWSAAALAVLALTLPSCMRGERMTILGYAIGPIQDTRFHTIYVPVFENKAFQAGPLRGLEYSLTEEIHREIERTTPWKIVNDRGRADTELLGAIVITPKNIINRNQLNEIREGEMVVQVELVWRDVRTGEILSRPGPGSGGAAPNVSPTPDKPIPKVTIQAHGRFLPELGESTTTALQRASKQMAVQIVSLMEPPW